MVRERVESSSINSIGYDQTRRVLEIEFTGGDVYAYGDVPPIVYDRLMTAESKGRFVNYVIKPNFSYRKLT